MRAALGRRWTDHKQTKKKNPWPSKTLATYAQFFRADASRQVSTHEMSLQQLLSGMGGMGGAPPAPAGDQPLVDTAEMVYISSLALLKMLKHGMVMSVCLSAL